MDSNLSPFGFALETIYGTDPAAPKMLLTSKVIKIDPPKEVTWFERFTIFGRHAVYMV